MEDVRNAQCVHSSFLEENTAWAPRPSTADAAAVEATITVSIAISIPMSITLAICVCLSLHVLDFQFLLKYPNFF